MDTGTTTLRGIPVSKTVTPKTRRLDPPYPDMHKWMQTQTGSTRKVCDDPTTSETGQQISVQRNGCGLADAADHQQQQIE